MNSRLEVNWFGRCCFKIMLGDNTILFDPYDRFCGVDMGLVDAQILISSSTWHDHGHIGAAPGAWVFSYPGVYDHKGLLITGLEVKEERGSPTVVFNVQYKDISVTNFADMGRYEGDLFTEQQRKVLGTTNIAFIRSGHEEVLKFCDPKIIIPEHYFPKDFVHNHIPEDLREDFLKPCNEIDKMVDRLGFKVDEVDGSTSEVNINNFIESKILRFLKIHPQVKYIKDSTIKRYW